MNTTHLECMLFARLCVLFVLSSLFHKAIFENIRET